MGATEQAQKVELRQREQAIERERTVPRHLAGPTECVRCNKANDRRNQGFAVCRSCMAEAAK